MKKKKAAPHHSCSISWGDFSNNGEESRPNKERYFTHQLSFSTIIRRMHHNRTSSLIENNLELFPTHRSSGAGMSSHLIKVLNMDGVESFIHSIASTRGNCRYYLLNSESWTQKEPACLDSLSPEYLSLQMHWHSSVVGVLRNNATRCVAHSIIMTRS